VVFPVGPILFQLTAEVFVTNIISIHGFPKQLYSDKSSTYINSFFQESVLTIGTSASLCAPSNGLTIMLNGINVLV